LVFIEPFVLDEPWPPPAFQFQDTYESLLPLTSELLPSVKPSVPKAVNTFVSVFCALVLFETNCLLTPLTASFNLWPAPESLLLSQTKSGWKPTPVNAFVEPLPV